MSAGILWLLPFLLQGTAMGVDEFGFHRRRTVTRWEWAGHLLDTLVFLVCLAWAAGSTPSPGHLKVFGALALVSCVIITKDEGIHQRHRAPGEPWVHALLFQLHPVVLALTAWIWIASGPWVPPGLPVPPAALAKGMLAFQAALTAGFLVCQGVVGAGRRRAGPSGIDNGLYDTLGERWYTATDDPVALLRAESRLRIPWVLSELEAHFPGKPLEILDVGCGGGFLANALAKAGHRVTGIDLSRDSLAVARRHDATGAVRYFPMDARGLGFPEKRFDGVCMMDFLEHLPEREEVIREAARVLKPGGGFFFHTFNRTPLAWLLAIKGVEVFVKNTPPRMHVYPLFLKPSELEALCRRHHLAPGSLRGVRPRVATRAFLRMLFTGRVGEDFRFAFTHNLSLGYCGWARKGTETSYTGGPPSPEAPWSS